MRNVVVMMNQMAVVVMMIKMDVVMIVNEGRRYVGNGDIVELLMWRGS